MPSAAARHPAHRTRPLAPRHPRRVSGPLHRPRPVPRTQPVPRAAPAVPASLLERLRALPDHRLLDRLLRGRAWVVLIAVALMGIVAMQVSLLKLNSGISRAVQAGSTLERQNADLEASIARLSSGERIRAAASVNGMVTPSAGDVGFLTARAGQDARLAAAHMKPASQAARDLMANHGIVPGSLATPVTTLAAVPVATAAAPAAVTPQVSAPAPVTPAPTAAPVAPAPAPVAAAPVTPAPAGPNTAAVAPTVPQG